MPDLRDLGAFSLAQQVFVRKFAAEFQHERVQMALAVQRCAGDSWKPAWIDLTYQSLPPFPLEGPGGGRQSRGLLTNRVTQKSCDPSERAGLDWGASRVGLKAEKGWTWENRPSSSEINPQSL